MRKLFLLLAVILLVSPIFAQEEDWEGNRQFAVTWAPIPLIIAGFWNGVGLNLGAEFAPVSSASVRANIHYMSFNTSKLFSSEDDGPSLDDSVNSLIRFSLEGRWYPMDRYLQGFFLGGGFQFHKLNVPLFNSGGYYDESGEWVEKKYDNGLNSYGIFITLGVKNIIGRIRPAFVIENAFDYTLSMKSDLLDSIPKSDGGWLASGIYGWMLGVRGFRYNFRIGVAF